jgi:hypothetical protein
MAGAARARGLAPGRGQSRWTGEFSASTSGENSRSSYTHLLNARYEIEKLKVKMDEVIFEVKKLNEVIFEVKKINEIRRTSGNCSQNFDRIRCQKFGCCLHPRLNDNGFTPSR